jgi:hypothetical protein
MPRWDFCGKRHLRIILSLVRFQAFAGGPPAVRTAASLAALSRKKNESGINLLVVAMPFWHLFF